jgi:hypothetical protein
MTNLAERGVDLLIPQPDAPDWWIRFAKQHGKQMLAARQRRRTAVLSAMCGMSTREIAEHQRPVDLHDSHLLEPARLLRAALPWRPLQSFLAVRRARLGSA